MKFPPSARCAVGLLLLLGCEDPASPPTDVPLDSAPDAPTDRTAPPDAALIDAASDTAPDTPAADTDLRDAAPADSAADAATDAATDSATDAATDSASDRPAAIERCNGLDDDGNGTVDDLAPSPCATGPCMVGRSVCRAAIAAGVEEAPRCERTSYVASTVVCRASTGACDTAEYCTGSSPMCPDDARMPPGAVCGANGLTCAASGVCGVCASGEAPCNGRCAGVGRACSVGVGACARTGSLACGESPLVAVVPAEWSSCAILGEGTVNCWGSNLYGALGVGLPSSAVLPAGTSAPVVGLTGVIELVAGYDFHCALQRDGAVFCWGSNRQGVLGAGLTDPYVTAPVRVGGLDDAIQIAAGRFSVCAVRRNGTVSCWGGNANGQLGDGTRVDRRSPVPVAGLTGATQVAVGVTQSCARRTDGSLWCWGPGVAARSGTFGDAVEVSLSESHACARFSNGTVGCVGHNDHGQLGVAPGPDATSLVMVPGITSATALASGSAHTCALLADGTVRCWGFNGYGDLGLGTTGTVPTMQVTVLGVSDAVRIASRADVTCAVLRDGSARCWGEFAEGVRGAGDEAVAYTATSRVRVVSAAVCSAVAGVPGVETCNRVDDDCDGMVDEGCP